MAVQDPTNNFGWNIPDDGGDSGTWGVALRQIFGEDASAGAAPNGSLDTILGTVQTTANAAMPKAGGIFTGEIDIFTARYEVVDLGGSISGSQSIDLSAGNFFHGTITGTTTFTFDNVPSADAVFFVLELTDGGSETINFPAAVRWPDGVAPSLTASGVDLLVFYTRDGGTTWRGAAAMINSS